MDSTSWFVDEWATKIAKWPLGCCWLAPRVPREEPPVWCPILDAKPDMFVEVSSCFIYIFWPCQCFVWSPFARVAFECSVAVVSAVWTYVLVFRRRSAATVNKSHEFNSLVGNALCRCVPHLAGIIWEDWKNWCPNSLAKLGSTTLKASNITISIGSMYGIYANIGGILMGSMLPYIAAPWILWDMDHMGLL